jgi:type 1 glutamine amidotransferase
MVNRREFLAGGMGMAVVAATGSRVAFGAIGAPGTRRDWFRKGARTFLLDFQFPDPVDQAVPGMPHLFTKVDPAALVDQVAASGANVFILHAKDNQGNCYFQTKAGHQHSDLHGRDLVREVSELCRKKGLGIVYYVQLGRDRRSFEEHADRQAIDEEGNPIKKVAGGALLPSRETSQVVCMNGPHRTFIKQILTELCTGGYDFDGFWLDGYNWWGRVDACYCQFCKAAYRKDTGAEIPKGDLSTSAEGKRYIHWRWKLNTEIMRDLEGTVRALNPTLTLTHNASAELPNELWDFCDTDDYVTHEYHFSEGYDHLSLLCQSHWALKPGVPYEIEIWRFNNRHGGRRHSLRAYDVREPEVLLAEMGSVVANGGFPQYYDQANPDGTLDQRSLAMLTPAFRDVAARQPWANVGEPVGYATILWSKSTQMMAAPVAQKLYEDALQGSFAALTETHLPTALLSERDLAAGKLRGAKVVVLDAVECLSAECCQAIRAFVEAGGGLVVTGRSSMSDEDGNALKNFGLADVLGADYMDSTPKWYSFMSADEKHPVTEGLDLKFPMSVFEMLQVRTKPHAGATILGTIVYPMPGLNMGFPPLTRSDVPSLLVREQGKGRVVYCSASLGAIYFRGNGPDYRKLLVNALQWAAGTAPAVTVEAPGTVESVAWHDGRRTVVHLVNRTGIGLSQGDEGARQQEVIPVHGVRVLFDKTVAGSRVRLQPSGKTLIPKRVGERMMVEIERLETWEVVEVS